MNKIENSYLIPVMPFVEKQISYGKGSYLYDIGGKKYLDLNAGQFCAVLGHSNEAVLDAIYSKINKLIHTSTNLISSEVVQCSRNIHRISGDMVASCLLLSTGAEVIEFCLRYAKHIQNKDGIICFDKGYHGLTLGAQSVTFSGIHARPHVKNVYPVPIPNNETLELTLAHLEKILQSNEIAAILLEPIVSVGGMLFPPAEWFHGVRELCDQYRTLLILDECQTGFGRTGNWFAYQTYGFVPDMVATAKGIGLGFPVALAMFRNTLLPPPSHSYSMTHYSSHQNDSFAASVINAGLDYIEKNNLLSDITRNGAYFLRQLANLTEVNCHVTNARGCGLMLGVDLYFESTKDYRHIYKKLNEKMLERGVIIQGTNGGRTLRFLPDYLIKSTYIDYAIEVLDAVLSQQYLFEG